MDTGDDVVDPVEARLDNLRFILSGESAIALHTQFLYTHNHTDLGILKNIKVCTIALKCMPFLKLLSGKS